jgi:hypothetical protein
MVKTNGIKKFDSSGELEKMPKCDECGKKIGIFGGYRHPASGGKKYVCGNCFTMIDNSVEKWREFVLSNSFNNEKTSYNFNDMVSRFSNLNNDLKKIFTTFLSPGNLL